MPKISVLMPVYKTPEKFLREAVESILAQTLTDFEFLILDDCPTEPVEKIIRSYDDKRIKYFINETNLGISGSRNKLIDMAQGEYLAVMDHDDVSLPERFEKEAAYLDAHPEVGVVSCYFFRMIKGVVLKMPVEHKDIAQALISGCVLCHPAAMLRKSVLLQNKIYYDPEFSPAEDYKLFVDLMDCTQLHNLDEVLFHYRDHISNTSHRQKRKMRDMDWCVKQIVRAKHPDLYVRSFQNWNRVYCIRLFDVIPLMTIVENKWEKRGYLFGKILLYISVLKDKKAKKSHR